MLVSGNDFYASPRLSPDGRRLVWLTWNHPNMPWDGTELMGCDLDADGFPENVEQVAGGKDESIFQPEWSPDGTLHFVSTGRAGGTSTAGVRDVSSRSARGRRSSAYRSGRSDVDLRLRLAGTHRLLVHGARELAPRHSRHGDGGLEPLETPYSSIAYVRADGAGGVVFCGSSPTEGVPEVGPRLPACTRSFDARAIWR